jgi:hypothetical protein
VAMILKEVRDGEMDGRRLGAKLYC